MLLFGTILFGDKSGIAVHLKFLPLLRDFGSIRQYSWGSTCLAHLYRALCRASRFVYRSVSGSCWILWCERMMRIIPLVMMTIKNRSPSHRDEALFSQLLGFMGANTGQSQSNHQPDMMLRGYSLDARHSCRTSSSTSGGRVSGDSSRSDDGQGILNSQNSQRISMDLIEKNAKTIEHESDDYLVEQSDGKDDDENEDGDEDEIKNPIMTTMIMVMIQSLVQV
ncbi:hypothetical protein Ahy_B04g069055 [Arachis hypogaea]|uniref:Aminotransferase-like plant mobile domain-containing protein n=1 Tax=Arachis hypogaea TaxID=3818 RepID=A0A444ZBH9_ARAHY|nr:hypothetical protein Ahy_B04g069055 [Arachis hypogaea]